MWDSDIKINLSKGFSEVSVPNIQISSVPKPVLFGKGPASDADTKLLM